MAENSSTAPGMAGNNSYNGSATDDRFTAGGGNDLVNAGAGDDRVAGDGPLPGHWTYAVHTRDFTGASGQTGAISSGTLQGTVYGGAGADSILGGEGRDRLLFGAGDDTVHGGGGDDFIDNAEGVQLVGRNLIHAGDGRDRVYSGFDNDTVFGDAGDDDIFGEGGDDRMHGGAGADTFVMRDGDFAQGDFVDGGGGSGGGDFDVLDLSVYGWARTAVTCTSANNESGTMTFCDANGAVLGTMTSAEIEQVIPCFTAGTLIETPQGPRAVENIRPGDLVLTLDDGSQPVRWVGQRRIGLAELMADPSLQPVEIAPDALQPGVPDRPVRVSPNHRVLFGGAGCELYFGTEEVLVPAIQMVGQRGISQRLRPVTYVHVMFDRHQIVQTHGMWSESLQPGERSLGGMPDPLRDELLRLFPERMDRDSYPAARITLNGYETRVLLQA